MKNQISEIPKASEEDSPNQKLKKRFEEKLSE